MFRHLASPSLSRRFAVAAAILTATAVLLTSLASFWLVSEQRSAAAQLLQDKEIAFHAQTVSNNLQSMLQRIAEVADSPILATGLVDSAGRETYLIPFLNGFRQINGIPLQIMFTDFEGKEIATNGIARFTDDEMAWLKRQIDAGRETTAILTGSAGPELVGIELLRYPRTTTPEGAVMFKIRLGDLRPVPAARLAWGNPPAEGTMQPGGKPASEVRQITSPPQIRELGLRLEEDLPQIIGPLDDLGPQYAMIAGMAIGLAAVVFFLASRLAFKLTRDLRELEAFSGSLGDEGSSSQRAPLQGSAEVVSLARSVNRMLDRIYEQHTRLQNESEKFYQLANTIPQLAWIAGPDGSVSWYNDRWYDYTGTTPDQMKELGWQGIVEPSLLDQSKRDWQQVREAGKIAQFTVCLRGADGEYRHFYTSVAPLRDASGRIVQWFGTNTDVSAIEDAERAVRQSEERLQQGLVAARMAVWDWDLHTGRVSFAANLNSVFGQTWDWIEEIWPLVDAEDRPLLRAAINESMRERNGYQSVVRINRPDDGKVVWIEMRGRIDAQEPGRISLGHAVAIDITERKRAEEALRTADRRKDEFLAMLAHELRNPLAPISTAAQLLNMVYLSDPKVKQTTEIISRQVDHMTRLVDELLDVSRVTRGLVTINRVALDLCGVVREAVDQTRPLMEAKDHALTIMQPDQPVWVNGDQTRLVQIAANLLNNAAKYTPEGGRIRLAVALAGDRVELSVSDNGVGIGADLLPEVFELFTQGKRTLDRSQGGLGLGLALVKKLVELHGGEVGVRSGGVGRGSNFLIRLPVLHREPASIPAKWPAGPAEEAILPLSGQAPRRVLVVDDNIDAADSLTMLLEAAGHTVFTEYTARAALERAAAASPDLLFLDIGLPDMDGYELARRLRALPQTADAVMVAVTGYGQEQDHERSREAGFEEHLVKPVGSGRLAALFDMLASSAV